MRKSVRSVIRRIDEHNKRPQALNSTVTKIMDFHMKISKMNKTASWVTEEQKAPALRIIDAAREWITAKMEEQQALELHVDPVFTASELDSKVAEIKREFEKIKKIKKPKVAFSHRSILSHTNRISKY